ncbi:MAG: SoxXA-binding protein [Pseudomonadota bacterium]
MKTRYPLRLLTTAVMSLWLVSGCAGTANKASSDSKASPEAMAALAAANSAIKAAKANNWIWRDTEKFAEEAQAAADKGDNAVAIKLANKAKDEADNAVAQYNYEKAHPRGL